MAKVLLVVDLPSETEPNSGRLAHLVSSQVARFEREANGTEKPTSGSQRLSRNAWLLDAKNSLPFLGQVVGAETACGFSYTALLIEGEITPLVNPPSSKSSVTPLRV